MSHLHQAGLHCTFSLTERRHEGRRVRHNLQMHCFLSLTRRGHDRTSDEAEGNKNGDICSLRFHPVQNRLIKVGERLFDYFSSKICFWSFKEC